MTYRSTKTYGHDIGLSAVFRQPLASSHCNRLHGYALAFRIEFEATHLDERNWVVDFGALKPLKAKLEQQFDHKLLVAKNDPEFSTLMCLEDQGLAHTLAVDAVGCEGFAKLVFDMAEQWLVDTGNKPRVRVALVECREHGANSAIYSQ